MFPLYWLLAVAGCGWSTGATRTRTNRSCSAILLIWKTTWLSTRKVSFTLNLKSERESKACLATRFLARSKTDLCRFTSLPGKMIVDRWSGNNTQESNPTARLYSIHCHATRTRKFLLSAKAGNPSHQPESPSRRTIRNMKLTAKNGSKERSIGVIRLGSYTISTHPAVRYR